jgi:hypothetical protein
LAAELIVQCPGGPPGIDGATEHFMDATLLADIGVAVRRETA